MRGAARRQRANRANANVDAMQPHSPMHGSARPKIL